MSAIFKRELKSYFYSPLGYIYLGVMFAAIGAFFTAQLSMASSEIASYVFGWMFMVAVVVLPLLTMRLFSDDKRTKTDQLYLTGPVKISGVVLGKYCASLLVYVISICPTFICAIILATFVKPDWQMFLGNFLGLLLLGAAFIAIGMLISSLTESQVISAILTLAISVVIIIFDTLTSLLPAALSGIQSFLSKISIMRRCMDFTSGIIDLGNIIFFISIVVIFIFVTMRQIERKRWS